MQHISQDREIRKQQSWITIMSQGNASEAADVLGHARHQGGCRLFVGEDWYIG